MNSNIPSDDAAIFSDNTNPDIITHDFYGDDSDTEDPTGPRGQSKVNSKAMFQVPKSKVRTRRVVSPRGMPTGKLPNLTPGARRWKL